MKTTKNKTNTGNIDVGMLWFFSEHINEYYNPKED